MAFAARSLWHRVYINDVWTLTKGDVRISESVDQLSRVAEFELATQPEVEPEEGDEVLIQLLDFDEETVTAVFGGDVNSISVESQPFSYTITATDQLRLLDRVRQGTDLDLTGMTPKEALMEVLDDVGCTYDAADLADPVYTLGEREDLAWLVDTPGSQIANELSTVFGCVLLTVGNDRILWLSHDATPADGTGSYATYTRGTSIDFGGHGRVHGDRARIQNNWIVRGVNAQVSKQCTAQAWAKAVGTNPQLGRRRRTAEQTFTSDLIQSEDLAEAIVRRLMRETNRLPDERTTPMVNDINVHPASKLTIVDPTYGLGGTSYVTVLAVDRTGSRMTLRLAAGPGGSEGTVTTGVDKVCNDTHTDLDWPGDGFDFPDFDFPPIDLGDPIDFDLDLDIPPLFTPDLGGGTDVPYTSIGGTEPDPGGEVCYDLLAAPFDADWVQDNSLWGPPEAGTFVFDGTTGEASVDPTSLPTTGWGVAASVRTGVPSLTENWRLTARAQSISSGADLMANVAVIDNTGGVSYIQKVFGQITGTSSFYEDEAYEEDTVDDHGEVFGTHHMSTGFQIVIERLGSTMTVSLQNSSGSELESSSFFHDWDDGASGDDLMVELVVYSKGLVAAGDGGSIEFDVVELCAGGLSPVTPIAGDWTTEFGSATYPGDGALSFADTGDAQAFYDDAAGDVFPFAAAKRFRWSGHADITGTDECFIAFYLMDDAESVFAAVELQISVGLGDLVNFYQFVGPGDTVVLAIPDVFDFVMDWNPDADSLTLWIDGDLVGSVALGTWPTGIDIFPRVWHSEADTMAADLTGMVFVVGS